MSSGDVWGEDVKSECGDRISGANFCNYGSIVLSFRDVTTERTTDGRRTDRRQQAMYIRMAHEVGQQ